MTTTPRSTRPVPAERPSTTLHAIRDVPGDYLNDALGHIYKSRGLVAGAVLLAARVPFLKGEDKTLRRESARVAARALAAFERAATVLSDLTPGFTPEELSPAMGALDSAHGQVKAAVALLDGTGDRDVFDQCCQALDLYAMALERIESINLALYAASDSARKLEALATQALDAA